MAKTGCQIGCTIFFVILALIFLAFGLFMLFGFDKIYNKVIDSVRDLKSSVGLLILFKANCPSKRRRWRLAKAYVLVYASSGQCPFTLLHVQYTESHSN